MALVIVTPVYNDWQNLEILIREISTELADTFPVIKIVAVNDSSSEQYRQEAPIPANVELTTLDLAINVGHQRAIIIGLCYVSSIQHQSGYIIVMDSDGEDKPTDIPRLIKACTDQQMKKIIFARRDKRSEGMKFKISYYFYKILFYILTSKNIKFGNFSCIPVSFLPKIIHNADFWNHYSASVIKSKMPYDACSTSRGKRYAGKSKMNFTNLVIHGLSALSLYLDVIIVRFLKLSLAALSIVLGLLFVILYVKYFTELAIPGWASVVFAITINILVTISLFTFIVILLHLSNRSQKPSHPINFYQPLILSVNEHK